MSVLNMWLAGLAIVAGIAVIMGIVAMGEAAWNHLSMKTQGRVRVLWIAFACLVLLPMFLGLLFGPLLGEVFS